MSIIYCKMLINLTHNYPYLRLGNIQFHLDFEVKL